jgi:hypothetical protein
VCDKLVKGSLVRQVLHLLFDICIEPDYSLSVHYRNIKQRDKLVLLLTTPAGGQSSSLPAAMIAALYSSGSTGLQQHALPAAIVPGCILRLGTRCFAGTGFRFVEARNLQTGLAAWESALVVR